MAETLASIATFTPLSKLPNIAGAIDATHIKIKAPKDSAVDYFSRYQQHNVVMQAVVNGKGAFMDVTAGFPGSTHDAQVLRNSLIYKKAEHGDILAAGPIHRVDGSDIIKINFLKWSGLPHYFNSVSFKKCFSLQIYSLSLIFN